MAIDDKIQFLNGTENNIPLLDKGEPYWAMDNKTLFIGNGNENVPISGIDDNTVSLKSTYSSEKIESINEKKMPVAPVGGDLWAGSGSSWYKLEGVGKESVILISEEILSSESNGVITIDEDDFLINDVFRIAFNGAQVIFEKGVGVNELYQIGKDGILYKFNFDAGLRTITVSAERSLVSNASNPNLLINGNFDIWQRGTVQTTSGYGSDDRWVNEFGGHTATNSRQNIMPGELIGSTYYSRVEISTIETQNHYHCVKFQRIENVRITAGNKVTLSFFARSDSNTNNMAIEFAQTFDGGEVNEVLGIGVAKINVSTQWEKYVVTADIPNINGKIIGENNNFACCFWLSAGSLFDFRTDSLGFQSGTFDIAQVKLEIGDKATPFVPRPIGEEIALCQRYFEKSYNLDVPPGTDTFWGSSLTSNSHYTLTNIIEGPVFKVRKRVNPVCTIYADTGQPNKMSIAGGVGLINITAIETVAETRISWISLDPAVAIQDNSYHFQWTAEAEL